MALVCCVHRRSRQRKVKALSPRPGEFITSHAGTVWALHTATTRGSDGVVLSRRRTRKHEGPSSGLWQ